jgi:cellobiose-specific phosphotransferase system component IIC
MLARSLIIFTHEQLGRRYAMASLKMQIMETIAALMMAAFGLIAALAWNEAIKQLIAQYFAAGDALMGLFVYAIIVTVIAIIAGLLIARSLAKLKALDAKSK